MNVNTEYFVDKNMFKMDYKSGWNQLVSEYKKNLDAKEDKIHTQWELYFSFLFHYSSDDIDSKRSLHIGSKDREIPDIILRSNQKDLCVVELKRYSLSKNTDFEKQLLNYMSHTDMRLSIGVIICQTIDIYYYNQATNEKECLEIPFEENSELGEKFVELFGKENYSEENIIRFIREQNKFKSLEDKIKSEATAILIKQFLIEHFGKNFDTELVKRVVSELNISLNEVKSLISPIIRESSPLTKIGEEKRTVTLNGTILPLYRDDNQSVKDFIKKTLTVLFDKKVLTKKEIVSLQNKKFSMETFGIQYPLLAKNYADTFELSKRGTLVSRYCHNFTVGNFFVCNQWSLDFFDSYDKLIAQWLINLEKERR